MCSYNMKRLPDNNYEVCQYEPPYTLQFPKLKTVVKGVTEAVLWITTRETLATSTKIAPSI